MTDKRTPNNPEPVEYELCVMSKGEQIEETEKRFKMFEGVKDCPWSEFTSELENELSVENAKREIYGEFLPTKDKEVNNGQ